METNIVLEILEKFPKFKISKGEKGLESDYYIMWRFREHFLWNLWTIESKKIIDFIETNLQKWNSEDLIIFWFLENIDLNQSIVSEFKKYNAKRILKNLKQISNFWEKE